MTERTEAEQWREKITRATRRAERERVITHIEGVTTAEGLPATAHKFSDDSILWIAPVVGGHYVQVGKLGDSASFVGSGEEGDE